MAVCEHKDGCSEQAVQWVSVGSDRRAGLCEKHAAGLQRKLEELRFHLGMLDMRCPECGNLAPEGFMHHDHHRDHHTNPVRKTGGSSVVLLPVVAIAWLAAMWLAGANPGPSADWTRFWWLYGVSCAVALVLVLTGKR